MINRIMPQFFLSGYACLPKDETGARGHEETETPGRRTSRTPTDAGTARFKTQTRRDIGHTMSAGRAIAATHRLYKLTVGQSYSSKPGRVPRRGLLAGLGKLRCNAESGLGQGRLLFDSFFAVGCFLHRFSPSPMV